MSEASPAVSPKEAKWAAFSMVGFLALIVLAAGIVGLIRHSVLAFIFTLIGSGVFCLAILLPIGLVVGARIDVKRARKLKERDKTP